MTLLVLLGLLLTCPDLAEPPSRRSFHGWQAIQILDSVMLARAAINLLNGEPDDDDVRLDLVLTCDGDRTISAALHGSRWVSRSGVVSIPLSLDGGPFIEADARGGPFVAVFERPKVVIQQLLQHRHLVVRVQPYGQPKSQDIRFELDGLDRVIWPLADACGWDPSKSDDEKVPNASQ